MDVKKPSMPPGALTFQDFVPEVLQPASDKGVPTYAKFPTSGAAANKFLEENPSLEVVSCETIHVKLEVSKWTGSVKHKTFEPAVNQTSFRQYGENTTGSISALRLWLRPTMSAAPQKIGWKTVVSNHVGTGSSSLMELAEQVNLQHRTKPVPGRIVNVQTLVFCSKEGAFDVEDSKWTYDANTLKPQFTQALRIFYVVGEPCRKEIGFADFFPQSEDGKTVKQFSQILRDINNFREGLPGNSAILNLQTLLCRQDVFAIVVKPFPHLYSTRYQSDLFWERFIRFVRVVYVVNPEESKTAPPAYETPKITCRLFTPAIVQDPGVIKAPKFEDLDVMKDRIGYWISQQSAKVLAVESVDYKAATGAEKLVGFGAMNTWHETVDDKHGTHPTWEHYLRCVRVYFEGETTDPKGFEWPRNIDDVRKEGKLDRCIII